ncbi:MAG: hypothetical protein IPH40_08070 [Polaromonas sp.]|nr:hypothetical protein [Polaromonas sp.]
MKHIKQILIAISVVALLTACSGGDDATTPDETNNHSGCDNYAAHNGN